MLDIKYPKDGTNFGLFILSAWTTAHFLYCISVYPPMEDFPRPLHDIDGFSSLFLCMVLIPPPTHHPQEQRSVRGQGCLFYCMLSNSSSPDEQVEN